MIRRIGVAALSLMMTLSVSSLVAQPDQSSGRQQRQRPTAEQRAQIETDSLTKVLTLTEEQSTQLMAITLKNAQKADSLMSGQRSREMMEKVRALSTEKVAEVEKILDKTQLKTYQRLVAKQAAQMEARRSQQGEGGQRQGGGQRQ